MKTTFTQLAVPFDAVCTSPGPSRFLLCHVLQCRKLFDIEDNPLKNDDAFTPTGSNRWTYKRMIHKRNQLLKVFFSLGDGILLH